MDFIHIQFLTDVSKKIVNSTNTQEKLFDRQSDLKINKNYPCNLNLIKNQHKIAA